MTMENLIQEEKQRLTALLFSCNISEKRIEALETVIDNTAFMKVKLDAAREAIKTSNVAIPYEKNDGGTKIIENPLFKGYESLWKAYMNGMDRILACLPQEAVKEAVNEDDRPKTVLEKIRERHAV